MGNSAVITADGLSGIYLHWNGGVESVLAFLAIAKKRGYRDPSTDTSYAMARLTGLIHEFFGTKTETSLGIGTIEQLDTDNGDNGTYEIGRDWTIKNRYAVPTGVPDQRTVESLDEYQLLQYNGILADSKLS